MIHQVAASISDSVSYEITFVFVVIAITLQVTYLSGKHEKFGNEREFYRNKFVCTNGKCLSNKDLCRLQFLSLWSCVLNLSRQLLLFDVIIITLSVHDMSSGVFKGGQPAMANLGTVKCTQFCLLKHY